MSPISHPSAGSLRPAAWSGALALLLMAADVGAGGVVLRLERTLLARIPAALDDGTAILLRFGTSEIEQQIRLARERITRLERTNQELAAAISSGDELTSVLRTLQGLQDQVRDGVRKAMDARVEAASRVPTQAPVRQSVTQRAVAPIVQGESRPVEAPASPNRTRQAAAPLARSVTVPVEAPAASSVSRPAEAPTAERSPPRSDAPATRARVHSSASTDASSFEIPMAGLPQWVVGGVLGAVILALLGWMANRFLARRKGGSDAPKPAAWAPATEDIPRASANPEDAAVGATTGEDATTDLDADQGEGGDAPQTESMPAAESTPARPVVGPGERWSTTVISRKAADPQALREVDTLIAFEQYDKAKALLDEMMVLEPDNPELVLRHYHVRTQGGIDTTDDDEALLKAMMDGPLSDTMLRVRDLGRGLMPGDPLFDDPVKLAAASQALKENKRGEAGPENAPTDDTVVQFTGTVKLDRSPLAGN